MWFLQKIEKESSKTQIVEYDKLYHAILKDLWYSGSFGEILKRKPREIHNIQEIWSLHKLRNILVHELNEPKIDMKKKAENYKRVILAFLQRVSEK